MIENFLRPPRTAGLVAADVVRALTVVSLVVTAIGWDPMYAGVLALALAGVMAPRFLGLRGGADAVVGLIILGTAWSGVLDLYRRIAWWDLLIHFACTGVLALLAYVALCRARVVPVPRTAPGWAVVMLTTSLGLSLSALWEIVEWFAHTYVSEEIYVGYVDTIGDMAAGAGGAVVAAVLLSRVRLLET